MPIAAIVDITRHIARKIAEASLSMDTVVHRYYEQTEDNFSTAVVRVSPAVLESEEVSRSQDDEKPEISIRVKKHVTPNSAEEVEDLLFLCQEIRDLLRGETVDSANNIGWTGQRVDPIIDDEQLSEHQLFVQEITLTYSYERTFE